MAEVFLSYKREDQALARDVAADLEAEGYSVFFDVRIGVGESWDATIERELEAARAVIVLWSPMARESQWVRREAREAMVRGILCPAMIAHCKLPLEFSDVQTADLIGRRSGDRAHPEWRRLCEGLGRCVGSRAIRPAEQLSAGSPPPSPDAPPLSRGGDAPIPARARLGQSSWLTWAAIALVAAVAVLLWQPWHSSSAPEPPLNTAVGQTTEGFRDTLADGSMCVSCPLMIALPGGTFLMGSPGDERGRSDSEDQRRVNVSEFAVSKFEITFHEWSACVADGGCQANPNPSDEGWGREMRPVINVSWNDAQDYTRWLSDHTGQNYRLLSQAEWEYATRAGSGTAFATGSTIGSTQANFSGWIGRTQTVGSYPANAFGLSDMHGNVAEWVEDCEVGSPCTLRVIRGGHWADLPMRSAGRYFSFPDDRSEFVGFRVARTPNE